MQKIKLLIADSGLAQPWIMPYWQKHFDCEIYQESQSYNSQNYAVLVDDRY